jgi:single-strand DNA-binding protein
MANDLNLCQFIGRLGRDPESRYMPNGDPITSFSLAVGSIYKNKQGEKVDNTEWVNVSVFGKLAEVCSQYLKKGSQVYVSGRMKTEKYTDKAGVEKYSVKIIADRMQMLDSKPESDRGTQVRAAMNAQAPSGNPFDDLENDIPF